MDWNAVVITLLSTTSLAGIAGFIVYYRENKKLKKNEVKISTVEAQKQEMDLATIYKDKVLELTSLMEQMNKKQDNGNVNQNKILKKLELLGNSVDILDNRVDNLDKIAGETNMRVSDIVLYLNGGFQDFLQHQHRPRKKQGPKLMTKTA